MPSRAMFYAHRSAHGAGREDVTETPTGWGVHEDVFCAGKEAVFDFLEGVLAEVVAIFPSTYLHIGGDEVWSKSLLLCRDAKNAKGTSG